MLNDLPDDLLHIIILKMDNRGKITGKPFPSEFPISYLKSLRDTSKKFRDIINNLKDQGIQYYRNEVKIFSQTRSNIPFKKKIIVLDDIDLINYKLNDYMTSDDKARKNWFKIKFRL